MIKWKLSGGKEPTRATDGSAGFDIYALESGEIRPGAHVLMRTGVHCAIPRGWVGIVKPRSGLAVRHGVDILAGVIDSDYRGEIHVALINHTEPGAAPPLEIKAGERIAQMIVVPAMMESTVVDDLPETDRGSGGFGSTGRG